TGIKEILEMEDGYRAIVTLLRHQLPVAFAFVDLEAVAIHPHPALSAQKAVSHGVTGFDGQSGFGSREQTADLEDRHLVAWAGKGSDLGIRGFLIVGVDPLAAVAGDGVGPC